MAAPDPVGKPPSAPRHEAVLCLGSNINPETNMQRAVALLRNRAYVAALSSCVEAEAIGTSGPNFLNMAAVIETDLDAQAIKSQVIGAIEQALGRVRTADKYAPRTIDIDIIVFDGEVVDQTLWKRAYIALTFAELLPGLTHPETGELISQVATRLSEGQMVVPRPDLRF
jgi:2-amino-4-hydroxy-6-hydroxymethyldihydropteridine diphosphokinase